MSTASLWGSAWVLVDIGGAGVIDDAQATLEFPAEGKAADSAPALRLARQSR